MPDKRIKSIFLFLIISIGLFYFVQKGPEFTQILNLSLTNLFLTSSIILIAFILQALKFKRLFMPFNIIPSHNEWFGLSMIGFLGNFIFFKAGTITMAVYLKKNYSLSYEKFITALTAERIFQIYASTIVGIILFLVRWSSPNQRVLIILCLVSLLSVLTYFLFYYSFKPPHWKNKIGLALGKILRAWLLIKQNKINSIILISIQVLAILFWAGRLYLAFGFIGPSISFYSAIALALTTFITGLANLIPGGLGIREVTAGLTMSLLGHSFDSGIYAVVLDRTLSTLWFTVLGIFYFYYLNIKKFHKSDNSL